MENIESKIKSKMQAVATELEEKELESVMRGENWTTLMQSISDSINTTARRANSESEVAFAIDHLLVNLSEMILVPAGYEGYRTCR